MTFNVLADKYALPERYPWAVDSGSLSWETRRDRVLQQILEQKADVICLQVSVAK